MATLPTIEPALQQIEATVREITRPKAVGMPRVSLRQDHSGDQAAYITFRIPKSAPVDQVRVLVLADFADKVAAALYRLGLGLFYYVDFEEGR